MEESNTYIALNNHNHASRKKDSFNKRPCLNVLPEHEEPDVSEVKESDAESIVTVKMVVDAPRPLEERK